MVQKIDSIDNFYKDEKMWVKICITHGKFGFLPSIKMCMVVRKSEKRI